MTDPAMSPAQKIRKALAERYCCEPDDIPTSMCEMESVASIVLRVAAEQVGPDGHDYSHGSIAELMWRGRREARRELLAIASELKGQP
jgi:hypothetical protein